MRAYVVFRLPDGSEHTLGSGDLIGRHWTCALCLVDGRVSEAHALVSARGDELRLLALRGRFLVDDVPVVDAVLAAGQRVRLADGLELGVEAVVLPSSVLGVEGDGVVRQALLGVTSLRVVGGRIELVPGFQADAEAQLFSDGDAWFCRRPGGEPVSVAPGATVAVGSASLRFVEVPLAHAATSDTRLDAASQRPMRVVARFHEVRFLRDGEPDVVLDGLGARLVSELVSLGGSVPWQVVAREMWGGETREERLRRRWDVTLTRLRMRLREGRIRPDFVRSDRSGCVSLSPGPDDQIVDET